MKTVNLGSVIKLHLPIYNPPKETWVWLQTPHLSEAVQEIEKKSTDYNFGEHIIFTCENDHIPM